MDKIMELQIFLPSENYTKRSNNMVSGLKKIMYFVMDIDKFNLANLMGKVMDEIMEYHIVLPECTEG